LQAMNDQNFGEMIHAHLFTLTINHLGFFSTSVRRNKSIMFILAFGT
jgi:hypothetical protein